MMTFSQLMAKAARVVLAGTIVAGVVSGTAMAQDDNPNQGAVSFSGGLDILPGTTYVFRGIVQESDPKLTMWPYGEIGIALTEGDGSVKSSALNIGVWNSLNTGSSGSDGPGKLHYESDFYATLALGLSRGLALDTTYTAYTSPNGLFSTVNELSLGLSLDHHVAPYAVLAFELGDDGQADGGSSAGTYLELGVGPSYSLADGALDLTFPVKIGMSVNDYYELDGEDKKFGYFSAGVSVSLPLNQVPARFGSWDLHGAADILLLGDTTEAFNNGDNVKGTLVLGLGLSY